MIPQWWWLAGVLVILCLGYWTATQGHTKPRPPQRAAPPVPPTLTWNEQTLALREELEACSPELRDAPFLYALANQDFAVHLRWEVEEDDDDDPRGTGPRAWARVALFRRRPEGYQRLEENMGRGVGNEQPSERLVAVLHDWANKMLPPALTHAAGYVPIAERDGPGALRSLPTDLYATSGLEPASVAPLVAEVGPLPDDYVAMVERWGDPMVNGFVRVHSPARVLDRYKAGRDDAGRFFFWDASADLLDRKDFADTVEVADTFDGDRFLAHTSNPGWVFFAPRDDDRVECFPGLWSAIEAVVRRRALGRDGLFYLEPLFGTRRGQAIPTRRDAADGIALLAAIERLGLTDRTAYGADADEKSTTLFLPALRGRVTVAWPAEEGREDPHEAVVFASYMPPADPSALAHLTGVLERNGYSLDWREPESE